jgi:uncharacterized protein (DUF4415 family)
LTDEDGEVRELSEEDFKRFRPASDVLPPELLAVLPKRKPGQRGRQKAPTKSLVTLRLDAQVLDYFKAQGPRWQTRINEALKKAMAEPPDKAG